MKACTDHCKECRLRSCDLLYEDCRFMWDHKHQTSRKVMSATTPSPRCSINRLFQYLLNTNYLYTNTCSAKLAKSRVSYSLLTASTCNNSDFLRYISQLVRKMGSCCAKWGVVAQIAGIQITKEYQNDCQSTQSGED